MHQQYAIQERAGGRVVKLTCPVCGREWDVAHRGRETGFVVAAANHHVNDCSLRQLEAQCPK